ncbi:MAG: Stealth CR1 domain-containing protein [Bacteroidales bacterium]|nr:Stealth CR1 domain-containing protein [Bacteroidales bacterium]
MMKIDAVITWVDGNDPVHMAKRHSYGPSSLFKMDDIAGSTRYASVGEIFWCVASLNRFAPWINKIYIVTDGQDPKLDEFIAGNFQDPIPMEIIDHNDIFKGHEEFLPTFCSVSIETMTWRIPGLSEHYLELNDDMMLVAPVQPSDFFTPDGKSICYADKYSMFWTWVTRQLKPKKNGKSQVTFKGLMYNAARLAGHRHFFYKIDHTPRAMNRLFYESFYSEHPELMIRNIRHRFRDPDQYTPEVLQYMYLQDKGLCERRPVRGNLLYLIPKDRPGYIEGKLSLLDAGRYRFCCFNSVDQASPEDLAKIRSWISRRLSLEL